MKAGSSTAVLAWVALGVSACSQQTHAAKTYYVDCGASARMDLPSAGVLLRSLSAVNYVSFAAGDKVLFKRGTTCSGALHPRGSGSEGAPIRLGAFGRGSLPQIRATSNDEAALRLFNQEFWEIESLDLSGSRVAGISIDGDAGMLRHLYLRDLRVHDVRGEMLRKESGLVVIGAGRGVRFEDVLLDGIVAYATTQWSGIFVSHASHVRVVNSTVHDVQGDGIAIFNTTDGVVAHSAAWHTGMQHWQTIGTPNGIWTWRCTDCIVEDNEAFLTDSPGVDGGGFDIDFGNTRNTVRKNFAHDTAGYCVSVFGAFGPTIGSVVADNLCVNNGLSPRLAQRQGALLIQTWQHGTIKDVDIYGNRIDWQPPGVSPAIQIGVGLEAAGIVVHDNEIRSSGPAFVHPGLPYSGEHNIFEVQDAFTPAFGMKATRTAGWRLEARLPSSLFRDGLDDRARGLFVSLQSAALQFGHAGLGVSLITDGDASSVVADWKLREDGIAVGSSARMLAFSLALISPQGAPVHEWKENPGAVELGLALRQTVGPPVFGFLDIDKVEAH